MNSEMLHAVADAIETHPEQYNQHKYVSATDCGTAYCIAGWAAILSHPGARLTDRTAYEWGTAALGLAGEESWLFGAGLGPLLGHTVPEALHKIAEGAPMEELWGWPTP